MPHARTITETRGWRDAALPAPEPRSSCGSAGALSTGPVGQQRRLQAGGAARHRVQPYRSAQSALVTLGSPRGQCLRSPALHAPLPASLHAVFFDLSVRGVLLASFWRGSLITPGEENLFPVRNLQGEEQMTLLRG